MILPQGIHLSMRRELGSVITQGARYFLQIRGLEYAPLFSYLLGQRPFNLLMPAATKYGMMNMGMSPQLKVAVNVSSSGKPVLRFMYYVNEPGLTLLMKKNP